MNELDIAWAAGFLDGEGCFSLRSGAGEGLFYAAVWANQTTVAPLEKLKNLFGGSIYQQKVYRSNHKPTYVWTINGRNVEIALKLLVPYLVVKQRQAAILLEFRSLLGARGQKVSDANVDRRMVLWAMLRQLNTRGVDDAEETG